MRMDIITGKYPKGEILPESALANHYKVSRGPIRVAMQSLESEKLLEVLPNSRKRVLGFSAKQVKDLYDFREMIEKRAVEYIFEEEVNFFSPILNVLQLIESSALGKTSGKTDWFDLDVQFHRAVIESSGNHALLKAWNINSPIMYALLVLNTSKDYREQYIREFYDKHRKLFELMVTKNKECFDAIKTHIFDARALSDGLINSYDQKNFTQTLNK
jgi:DNA-binding GntR family transcriptional regulator